MHPSIEKFIRDQCSTLILSNLQFPKVQGYINAAHRCGVPVIGHIASWDHPVGKGVVSPYCDRYIVQNSFMANALCKYHGISNKRIQVTGWPQMDMLATKKPGRAYKDLLRTYGIPDDKPCVLIAGNSENNSPYEPNFVSRVVKQREQSAAGDKFSIVFRPHPRDSVGDSWKKRYTSILDKSDLYVQKPSYDDTDTLATLLQHVDCVVTNAGTILLDALVCNRPVVCVLYDEGGPKGSRFAYKNVIGHHYHDLMESGAFYIAYSFDEYLGQMKRALRNPDELEKQRREIVARIVGKVDGQAGSRVVEAVVGQIRKDQHPME